MKKCKNVLPFPWTSKYHENLKKLTDPMKFLQTKRDTFCTKTMEKSVPPKVLVNLLAKNPRT
ncbi:hypothetical protein NECAME_13792 [Necator americanus]|uniref:Uncharacterized protein n=1 Tax=Necator americanus TaxID=51031 RepID=W2SSP4_NECAM|nr:hypothetical protein NECAME_13792 [Necator americanus]ETN72655.1 hypothetical protein NECAME_13792 [Necator americanus]